MFDIPDNAPEISDSTDIFLESVDAFLALLKKVDPRVFAFRKAVVDVDQPFIVAAVENIGYKRTKRAESERPNDLFTAVASDSDSDTERRRVLDIDLCNTSWRVEIDEGESPQDLLSILRQKKIWS